MPPNVLLGSRRCPAGSWTQVGAGPSVWFFRRLVVTPGNPGPIRGGVRIRWRAYLSVPPYYMEHFADTTTASFAATEVLIGPFAIGLVMQVHVNPNKTCLIEMT